MKELVRALVVAEDTVIEIHGHTDNVGNPQANQLLSEARAMALRSYLEKNAPANFPRGRIMVYAHGQGVPVQPNTTASGRAANRRVDIVLKANR